MDNDPGENDDKISTDDREEEFEWTTRKEDKLINLFEKCTFLYDKDVPD